MSNWTEFNKHLYQDNTKRASIVGQSTLLNAKADEHNTIYTVGERSKFITCERGVDGQITWITCDQGIHGPAMEVKFTMGREWEDVQFRVGGLHSSDTWIATIGDHIAGSELPLMWVQSGIITELQTRYSEEETTRPQ